MSPAAPCPLAYPAGESQACATAARENIEALEAAAEATATEHAAALAAAAEELAAEQEGRAEEVGALARQLEEAKVRRGGRRQRGTGRTACCTGSQGG